MPLEMYAVIALIIVYLFYSESQRRKIVAALLQCKHCGHDKNHHFFIMRRMTKEELGPSAYYGEKVSETGCKRIDMLDRECPCPGYLPIAVVKGDF
jgi:hypothetical protein